jgi:hypothetical protein
MKRRQNRVSASPLIDPTVSSLVLILPEQENFAGFQASKELYQRHMSAIAAAANIVEVPVFLLFRGPDKPRSLDVPVPFPHRLFTSDKGAPLWQQAAFSEALDREDRSILVLAGVWLEYDILATALYALTDGYDVYVILDAAPARSPVGARLSRDRLLQFGATPVLCAQVIHEWCIETMDIPKRSALANLLATCTS